MGLTIETHFFQFAAAFLVTASCGLSFASTANGALAFKPALNEDAGDSQSVPQQFCLDRLVSIVCDEDASFNGYYSADCSTPTHHLFSTTCPYLSAQGQKVNSRGFPLFQIAPKQSPPVWHRFFKND